MRVIVKKWGNSASIRIPSAIMHAARLKLDAQVEIREEDGRIIIDPIREAAVCLDDLLGGITLENIHGEIDFGEPLGNETF